MKPLERVMRVMTHINIGATLGTAAWVLWSGARIVTGAGTAAPPPLAVPVQARHGTAALPCCWVPEAEFRALQAKTGTAPVAPERLTVAVAGQRLRSQP